jgi:predicted AAA+ superfamily ATPase
MKDARGARTAFPNLREASGLTLYLDEVQSVPGWEGLVRRLMDEGGVEVFVSGSSAKLLSREVATSLRGRAMEVLVHPFSFREALRHAGAEPMGSLATLTSARRAALDQRLRQYLSEGGFPEAQRATPRDRAALLGGYVDAVVLRDVIERHAVTNPLALRWIERQLLANPGGASAAEVHDDARPFLVTLDAVPPRRPLPKRIAWAPAARWLLEEM